MLRLGPLIDRAVLTRPCPAAEPCEHPAWWHQVRAGVRYCLGSQCRCRCEL